MKSVFLTLGPVTQELEELVKEKEKDLEKVVERGNALVQDEQGAACAVVKETLKGLNQSWARLDHMVNISDLQICLCCLSVSFAF